MYKSLGFIAVYLTFKREVHDICTYQRMSKVRKLRRVDERRSAPEVLEGCLPGQCV